MINEEAIDYYLNSINHHKKTKFIFWKINPNEGSIEIQMSEKVSNTKEFVVLEAYMFPFINVLWLGCLIMVIGTVVAILERRRVNKVVANV